MLYPNDLISKIGMLRADPAQGGRLSATTGWALLLLFLVEQHVRCFLPQLTDEFCGWLFYDIVNVSEPTVCHVTWFLLSVSTVTDEMAWEDRTLFISGHGTSDSLTLSLYFDMCGCCTLTRNCWGAQMADDADKRVASLKKTQLPTVTAHFIWLLVLYIWEADLCTLKSLPGSVYIQKTKLTEAAFYLLNIIFTCSVVLESELSINSLVISTRMSSFLRLSDLVDVNLCSWMINILLTGKRWRKRVSPQVHRGRHLTAL